MKEAQNRVEKELGQWLKREQRFKELFSFSLGENRVFLREKLKYYRAVSNRYRDIANREEKLTLRMVREERRALEKELYPNLLMRLTYKVFSRIAQKGMVIRNLGRQTTGDRQLRESLRKLGFPEVSVQSIHKGKEALTLPVSYYVGENKRMEIDLSVRSDSKGQYRLEGIKAILHQDGKPDRSKGHYFKLDRENPITSKQVYNLLSGRSTVIGNGQNKHWAQLDLNDRNTQGNYRIKRFYPGYGYDLEKTLRQLPIKELKCPQQTRQLIQDLRMGEQREVMLIHGNKQKQITIEANPQFKSLNLYNEKGKKIHLREALKGKIRKRTGVRNNVGLRKDIANEDRIRIKRI